ncbi:MAG TPA: phenylalanine--tRNA ligase subunit alpha [Candidatus Nitrosocosmicus sp.]|nr:phenylalanine--tRNA ligase subunit alpha [Candidatus Nitrosocosmicus sp.]
MNQDRLDRVDKSPDEQKSGRSVSSLHPIERKILSILRFKEDWITDEELAAESNLTLDQIRRGVEWLKYKNLIQIDEFNDVSFALSKSVLEADKFVLPERKLVNTIQAGTSVIPQIIKSSSFKGNSNELFGAIRYSKKNHWVHIEGDKISLLDDVLQPSDEEQLIDKLFASKRLLLSKLDSKDKTSFEDLKKRPNILTLEKIVKKRIKLSLENTKDIDDLLKTGDRISRKMSKDILISGEWKNIEFEQLDVEAPLPLVNCGMKNPLIDFIDEVKEILIGMGFSEIEGSFTQPSFWNFDALFIPQDHSAREMQDTFYLKSNQGLSYALEKEKLLIESVSQVHKECWNTLWNKEESRPYVLRTHTTPVTLQYLWQKSPTSDKLFLIDRVFRNEKVTYKHLIEFHQVEGIFTSKDANLRQLIGIQSEFYKKLGVNKIKFWPTFFPYTEPSMQSMVYNEKLNKWIELFGMGIFRTEVTKPLGIKQPVLAWGGGFERLAMIRFDLEDIRDLYSNKLKWLKSVPRCLL